MNADHCECCRIAAQEMAALRANLAACDDKLSEMVEQNKALRAEVERLTLRGPHENCAYRASLAPFLAVARAEEREACAMLLDSAPSLCRADAEVLSQVAAALRARGH